MVKAINESTNANELLKVRRLKNPLLTPYDLLRKLIDANIEYGWWDKVNTKVITPDMKEWKEEGYFDSHCNILRAYQVWKYKVGTCWDTSLLLWYSINKFKNTEPFVFFIKSFTNHTHTGCYYRDSTGWYWVEYSWYFYRGIHGPFKEKTEIFEHLNNMLSNSSYYHNIKVFNSNVNFLPIYKSENITSEEFLKCCYENASFYDSDKDQAGTLIKDNESGKLTYFSIKA